MRFRIALSQRGAFFCWWIIKIMVPYSWREAKETNETISVKTTGSLNWGCVGSGLQILV